MRFLLFQLCLLAKILTELPAWCRCFANSSDKQQLKAFLRHCIRLRLYRHYDPSVTEHVDDVEDKLFTNVITNDYHVLFYILTDHSNHNLRQRRYELTLAIKGDARNFFERQLFKDTN